MGNIGTYMEILDSIIQELKTSIQQAWNDISKVCLENLIKSMKNRIFELISVKGGSTHY